MKKFDEKQFLLVKAGDWVPSLEGGRVEVLCDD
jgi:hypothetical protein